MGEWMTCSGHDRRSCARPFPGVRDGWARFDGPAGTQMVDTAIEAMADWAAEREQRQQPAASFSAADACDELLERTRRPSAELFGASADSVCFGANMTTMTLAFTRAVGATLRPGDRVVGTRLDHDANVTPWRLACESRRRRARAGAVRSRHGRLDPQAVVDLIDERTAWVAVTGASNLLGTVPDLAPIVAAAHDAGARVFVDAVHLAPHRRIDVERSAATPSSPARTSGTGRTPASCAATPPARRAAGGQGPSGPRPRTAAVGDRHTELRGDRRRRGGRPVPARTRASTRSAAAEAAVFGPLLDGLRRCPVCASGGRRRWTAGCRPWRSPSRACRPTTSPLDLAAERIAAWAGHSYAVEAVDHSGCAEGRRRARRRGGLRRRRATSSPAAGTVGGRAIAACRPSSGDSGRTAASMRAITSSSRSGITSSAAKFSTPGWRRLAPVITVDTFGFFVHHARASWASVQPSSSAIGRSASTRRWPPVGQLLGQPP